MTPKTSPGMWPKSLQPNWSAAAVPCLAEVMMVVTVCIANPRKLIYRPKKLTVVSWMTFLEFLPRVKSWGVISVCSLEFIAASVREVSSCTASMPLSIKSIIGRSVLFSKELPVSRYIYMCVYIYMYDV
ncbi:hypothetical protein ASPTUDRAFT_408268 [Aspergillus tubingensis CBS 134.48]|uniref:Uncharacterized protein n=1 Tax=Aspergillus tubingensis (strain CBS 134.48) TaxID=767770 RepID=A0A1L9NGI0_ASPTC|nr:hypothetical protein ASPTUDRAFT_408268 [Aspergillus tubingensis CBS 134.48]